MGEAHNSPLARDRINILRTTRTRGCVRRLSISVPVATVVVPVVTIATGCVGVGDGVGLLVVAVVLIVRAVVGERHRRERHSDRKQVLVQVATPTVVEVKYRKAQVHLFGRNEVLEWL